MFLQVSISQSDCDCSNYKKCENPNMAVGSALSQNQTEAAHGESARERENN